MSLMWAWLAIAGGLITLVWSADRFVDGSAALARSLGISPLIIGLTIIGFGTSAPEMLVGGLASWQGNPGLAIGNAIGSNITNIALVLGATALLSPIVVASSIIHRELPIMLGIMFATGALLFDGELSQLDGILLITGLIILIVLSVRMGLREQNDPLLTEAEDELPSMERPKAIFWLIFGLVLLIASSKVLVWGAVEIAHAFGISDLIIGLTIVAIGTSLPELAASIASVAKNEHDLALGNIIGSNMFNILGVLALPALISPSLLPDGVLDRDYPSMMILSIALFFIAYGFGNRQGRINRIEGGLLLSAFIAYQVWLYQAIA